MQKLTSKEKMELEQVFSVIYVNRNSKFVDFYKSFYSNFFSEINKIKKRIKYIKRKIK
ncbi:Uncharacterised protein [Campylobacter sputorum subsp. bubulus]|uniref:Uncharacterized protein n=1 Tax=Campylobacter sputorum subsp. sputorum TaxID=32024 RepID=A0A381DHT3_9BACT|nr:hypothetical protein CSF_1114 [Campylobacter sputorum bv. faecalis CCUG 20703]ASM38661.1 hypothetical protein CSPARA_1101 [Campylobacter sputorum bv. paraureolyticus LMG 11764]SUX08691.1 Uncharacterised protein [Campylobacter sputorum subsp. bubulus]SUX10253.1 Uncharacterised protein [Campylobacter sputorum subsp. sputorum]